jgi:hypothetical protein
MVKYLEIIPYVGMCRSCGKYAPLNKNYYCTRCTALFSKKVGVIRQQKNQKNLNISFKKSKADKKMLKKFSYNEDLSKRQQTELLRTSVARELWEKYYQEAFPNFKRYLGVMRAWKTDVEDKNSVEHVMQQIDCILCFERGKSIQQVLKEMESGKLW